MRFFGLLFILILAGCERKGQEAAAPRVSYEMKTFAVESSEGCAGDSARCASYAVRYPVFSGIDPQVQAIIDSRIDSMVTMGNPDMVGKTMEQIGNDFVKSYEDFTEEVGPEMGWYYKADVSVNVLSDTLVSLAVQEEYFTGGAHGGYGIYFINVDPATGKRVTLKDVFKPGYEADLNRLAEKQFRETRSISDTTSLGNSTFVFPNDQFKLNDNYGFTADGITFIFNSYEVAAYSEGPTEILIPYEELSRLF